MTKRSRKKPRYKSKSRIASATPKTAQSPRTPLRRTASMYVAWIRPKFLAYGAVVVTCLGFYSDLNIFSARVSLLAPDPFDPKDPFSTRFQIANNGNFAIRDVSFRATFDAEFAGLSFTDMKTDARPEHIPSIPAGEAYSQWMKLQSQALTNEKDHIDLTATITYTTTFPPIRRTVKQRFVTARLADGSFHWEKYPLRTKT